MTLRGGPGPPLSALLLGTCTAPPPPLPGRAPNRPPAAVPCTYPAGCLPRGAAARRRGSFLDTVCVWGGGGRRGWRWTRRASGSGRRPCSATSASRRAAPHPPLPNNNNNTHTHTETQPHTESTSGRVRRCGLRGEAGRHRLGPARLSSPAHKHGKPVVMDGASAHRTLAVCARSFRETPQAQCAATGVRDGVRGGGGRRRCPLRSGTAGGCRSGTR